MRAIFASLKKHFYRIPDNWLARKESSILLLLIILIGLPVFRDFFLLKKIYFFRDIGSDSVNITYPGLIHLSGYLRSEGLPLWSFNQGLGQSVFPFMLSDNFFGLLLLFPQSCILYAAFFVEFLKVILAGLFFHLYLKTLSLSRFSSIVGGLLFSYSGYIILGSCWRIFSTEAVCVVLFLYLLERFITKSEWYLLPIPIALLSILQPFFLYLSAIFFSVYVVFRYFDKESVGQQKLLLVFLKLAGFGLLGMAIGALFMFSNIFQILQSPRVGGEASYFKLLSSQPVFGFAPYIQNVTAALRIFSSDMMGTGSLFKGWYNYLEAPIFYCGLLNLLLLPQIFIFSDRRHKILHSTVILLFVLPVVFPWFRHLFWAFTGDYYRSFSLFVVIFLLIFSMRTLNYIEKKSKVNLILLGATLFLLLAALFWPYYKSQLYIDKFLSLIAASFLIIYALLIYLLSNANLRRFAKAALLVTICCELAYFSSVTVNERSVITSEELNQKVGYNDYTVDAVSYLDSIDNSFFRICKYYASSPAIFYSLNDAMAQGYKGVSSYHPFNQKYYIKFLHELGVINAADESATRWAIGLESNPLLQTMLSVKYAFAKGESVDLAQWGYRLINRFGDVNVFQKDLYLPLGFTYNSFIRFSDFKMLSKPKKTVALLDACVINENDEKKLSGLDILSVEGIDEGLTLDEYRQCIGRLKEDAFLITKQNQNHIKGSIKLSTKKLLFFSIPYDSGWKAWVDGKMEGLRNVNIGFMGLILDKGEHAIELKYRPPLMIPGAVVSLAGISLYIFLIWRSRFKGKAI